MNFSSVKSEFLRIRVVKVKMQNKEQSPNQGSGKRTNYLRDFRTLINGRGKAKWVPLMISSRLWWTVLYMARVVRGRKSRYNHMREKETKLDSWKLECEELEVA